MDLVFCTEKDGCTQKRNESERHKIEMDKTEGGMEYGGDMDVEIERNLLMYESEKALLERALKNHIYEICREDVILNVIV